MPLLTRPPHHGHLLVGGPAERERERERGERGKDKVRESDLD